MKWQLTDVSKAAENVFMLIILCLFAKKGECADHSKKYGVGGTL